MTAEQVTEAIVAMIGEAEYSEDGSYADEQFPFTTIRSFEETGVLTTDAGFIVRADDGSEFQVTVVQSRLGKGD